MGILAVANPIELIRKNAKQRVNISVVDNNTGLPVDASELELSVTTLTDDVLYSEDFIASPTRVVKPAGTTGKYYILWGDGGVSPADPTGETDTPGDILFNWRVVVGNNEEVNTTQVAKIISASTLALLPYFRLLIDKSVKRIDRPQLCFLGYTDDMLLQFLEAGLQMINKYQPGSVVFSFETFPISDYRFLLLEAALLAGLMSQTLFAVDTDIPNYSDQGESFVIRHFPDLMQFLQWLSNKLDNQIPAMKLTFVNAGSVKVELGPNFRIAQVLTAAPSGSLFRNVFFR